MCIQTEIGQGKQISMPGSSRVFRLFLFFLLLGTSNLIAQQKQTNYSVLVITSFNPDTQQMGNLSFGN